MRNPARRVKCSFCKKNTLKFPYQIAKFPVLFCNIACKGKYMSKHQIGSGGPNWKGGTYSTIANQLCNSRYRRIRKEVLKRDGNCCSLCVGTEKLEAHHILEKRYHPTLIWRVENMITLCKKCHCGIRGKEESYASRFLDILANRMNSGNSRTDNPEPSRLKRRKVQRLPEHGTPCLITG